MIDELLKTRTGVVLLSVIWGLGLSALFKKTCEGPSCRIITYRGPPLSDAKLSWQYGTNTCYRLQPYPAPCGHH